MNIENLKTAVKNGDAEARCNLGLCYEFGEGVEQDKKEAVRLYELTAEQGFMEAQFVLGHCFIYGIGVKKSIIKAIKFWKFAANNGHAEAQYNLEYICTYHKFYNYVDFQKLRVFKLQNYDENNFGYYKLKAEQGQAEAQYMLGTFFEGGYIDGKRNFKEAARLYQLAAEQGHVKAQYCLADYYYRGIGVEEDEKEAKKWFDLAEVAKTKEIIIDEDF